MYEEFKIEKITPISKVEEAIIQLIKEMEATIVSQKQEYLKNNNNNDLECLCAQVAN